MSHVRSAIPQFWPRILFFSTQACAGEIAALDPNRTR
jgi:hypothetical protein